MSAARPPAAPSPRGRSRLPWQSRTLLALAAPPPLFRRGHPRAKQPVGRRLAAALLATAYGQDVQHVGPTYAAATALASAPGSLAVMVNFTAASRGASGMLVFNASAVCPEGVPAVVCEGFAVKTSDGVWHTTPTMALTSDSAALVLTVSGVATGITAVATRGMFADWPISYLYNSEGFPVVPWSETL